MGKKGKGEVLPVYGCREAVDSQGRLRSLETVSGRGCSQEPLWKELRDTRNKA